MNKVQKINFTLEEKLILVISVIKEIISVFLGPFLTAYFVVISTQSIIHISIYYIISYFVAGLTTLLISMIIKKNYKVLTFKVGIFASFIYIMSIILLREKIVDYLFLVAFLHGCSTAIYWFPFNLFLTFKISKSNKADFMIKNRILSSLVSILIPLFLASLITVTNYSLTAVLILFLSLTQFFLSFFLKNTEVNGLNKFKLKTAVKNFKNNKSVKFSLIAEYFIGMNISSGALQVLTTILILNSFTTNMNLGFISSFTSCISIISLYFYGKIYNNKDNKNIIILSSILPLIALLLLFLIRTDFILIIYNLSFVVPTTILLVIRKINLYTLGASNVISEENRVEFFTLRELVLNIGRITSFTLLLVAGLIGTSFALNIVLLILTLSIFLMGICMFFGRTKYFES